MWWRWDGVGLGETGRGWEGAGWGEVGLRELRWDGARLGWAVAGLGVVWLGWAGRKSLGWGTTHMPATDGDMELNVARPGPSKGNGVCTTQLVDHLRLSWRRRGTQQLFDLGSRGIP